MEKLYSDIKHPAGLSSAKKLYNAIRKTDKNVTMSNVKHFLSSKDAYTLHRQTKNRFNRRQFLFKHPGHTLLGDIAYMKYYESENTPYLLFLMDGYSRYLSIFPVKSLKSNDVGDIIDNFFHENVYRYRKFFTDEGKEFTNKYINKIYEHHKIEWYTTYSKTIKVSPVERVILTIKNKIKRYITHFNTEYYLDVLEDIVKAYNISLHRFLGDTPLNVHLIRKWNSIKELSQNLYKRHALKIQSVSIPLSKGQVVRIKSARHVFSRSIHVQNTYELFKIDTVNINHTPVTYSIVDLEDNPIKGIFYREELTEVEDKGLYAIEIVKKRRRRKKLEYLIRYVHYPSSRERWVGKNMLEKLN